MRNYLLIAGVLLYSIETINAQTSSDSITATIDNTENFVISGVVTEKNGQPLIGASLKIKENLKRQQQPILTANSSFPKYRHMPSLQVSYVGYMSKDIKITSDSSNYIITLNPNESLLDEVVVVGSPRKK